MSRVAKSNASDDLVKGDDVVRQLIALVLGIASAPKDIAAPNLRSYSYSGPWEDTVWGFKEQAYRELGWAFLIFGLIVLLAVLIRFLWSGRSRGQLEGGSPQPRPV